MARRSDDKYTLWRELIFGVIGIGSFWGGVTIAYGADSILLALPLDEASNDAPTLSREGVTAMGKPHRKPSVEVLTRLAFNTRTQRKAKGYTLERLAEITGLSVSYLGEIEARRINVGLANLQCLAGGLQTTEEKLLWPLSSDGVVVADLAQRCFTTFKRRSSGNGQEIEAQAPRLTGSPGQDE